MENLENFSKVKILVVGDVMLDRYWWGSVERISPEAPVPVVHLKETSLIAGGAANVAVNIAGLTAEAVLVGVVGDDEESALFAPLLNKSNISDENLIVLPGCQTTVKTRIVAHSQQVARIDQETKLKLTAKDEEFVWERIENLIDAVDLILLSDYNKGFLTANLLRRLITKTSQLGKFIIVDPKGKNFDKYQGASILTPNLKELAEALMIDEIESINQSGRELIKHLNLQALLITQGEEGMTLLEKNEELLHLNTQARKVYDVTGAGDTVIAALSVAIGAGLNFAEAARIANVAAGLVVEQVGTSTVTLAKLNSELAMVK